MFSTTPSMSISSSYTNLISSFLSVHCCSFLLALFMLYFATFVLLHCSVSIKVLNLTQISTLIVVICDLLTQNILLSLQHPFHEPWNFIAAMEQFLVMFYGLVCKLSVSLPKLYD